MRDKLLNSATVLMVCLAVASTAATMRLSNQTDQAIGLGPTVRHQPDWKRYAAGSHTLGPADAPVTITEFADFQCPFCKSLQSDLDTLRARHSLNVRLVFRHLPLPIHRSALAAARASECASMQGRFEPMAHALYESQDSIGAVPFAWFARRAQVPDENAFDVCMRADGPVPGVAEDTAAAKALGIRGTPTLLINDLQVEGVVPLDSLEAFVSRAVRVRSSREDAREQNDR